MPGPLQVVVIFSLLELILGAFFFKTGGGSALTGFRALRILRVLKLVNSWSSLKDFITALFGTVKELGNFCLIVLLTGRPAQRLTSAWLRLPLLGRAERRGASRVVQCSSSL